MKESEDSKSPSPQAMRERLNSGEDKLLPSRMFCQICGHLHKIDFWVPDEIWDACIHPKYKYTHICINCFMDRADERLLFWDKEIKLLPCSLATDQSLIRKAKEL